MTNQSNPPPRSIVTGLAMLGGLGMIIMLVVASIGVSSPPDSNINTLRLFFIIGVLIFIVAIGAWLALVRPFEHFDDINIPLYHGHNNHDHDETIKSDH